MAHGVDRDAWAAATVMRDTSVQLMTRPEFVARGGVAFFEAAIIADRGGANYTPERGTVSHGILAVMTQTQTPQTR